MASPEEKAHAAHRQIHRLTRLRQGLAVLVLGIAVVVGILYLLGHRQSKRVEARVELKIPTLGVEVQRSASGVTIAKDTDGKPIFRLHASHADTFRPGGEHVLRNVQFLAFSQDGLHADEISGAEFAYDAASGEVSARGPVVIALQARVDAAGTGVAAGGTPVEARARDLRFNLKSGLGTIQQGIAFHYLNAQGEAAQAQVNSRQGRLSLSGGVRIRWQRQGEPDLVLSGEAASVQRLPSAAAEAMLKPVLGRGWMRESEPGDAAVMTLHGRARLQAGSRSLTAGELRFWMRPDHSLRRLDAVGGVQVLDRAPSATPVLTGGAAADANSGARTIQVSAQEGHADFVPAGPHHAAVEHLILSGDASLEEQSPGQQRRLRAERLNFLFGAAHELTQLQASGQAEFSLLSSSARRSKTAMVAGRAPVTVPQRVSAPELDFDFVPASKGAPADRARLGAVAALGGATAELSSASGPVEAVADQFRLRLDARQQPAWASASGHVRLRQELEGEVRRSQSNALELKFAATGGNSASPQLEQVIETGEVELNQGGRQLQADRVVYLPGDHLATFFAQPGSGYSHGQVQARDATTTFRAPQVSWKQQPGGASTVRALGGVALSQGSPRTDASGSSLRSPVVITAESLEWEQPAATSRPLPADTAGVEGSFRPQGTAVFLGQVRLLQSPNLLRADRLVLDAARGVLTATGHVSADFVSAPAPPGMAAAEMGARATPLPVRISARELEYRSSQPSAVFQGGVRLHAADAVLQAPRLTITFAAEPAGVNAGKADLLATGGLEHALATGGVHITSGTRHARAAEAEFDFGHRLATLRGGSPSILDAEQGRISGDPLTFSLASDEIHVGSQSGERASGQTAIRK